MGLAGVRVLLPDVQQGLHLPTAQLLGHPV